LLVARTEMSPVGTRVIIGKEDEDDVEVDFEVEVEEVEVEEVEEVVVALVV
jgi:hypothetical protein